MKTLLLSLAAVAAVGATAAPAAAQTWGGYDRYEGASYRYHVPGTYGDRMTASYLQSFDWKLSNAAREGRMSWDQARELREQAREAQPLAWRVQTGQASEWEALRLQRTIAYLESAMARSARYERYDGYRHDDGYARYDRGDWRRDWR